MIERKIGAAVVFALVVQSASTLLWIGAAAERIQVLEQQVAETRPQVERLARMEAQLEAVQAQLKRIETKVERP